MKTVYQVRQKLCAQAKQAKPDKEFIRYFPWQVGVQLLPAKQAGLVMLSSYLGRQTPSLLMSPASSLTPWHHMIWDIPLVSLGQLCWLCPLLAPGAPSDSSLAGQHKEIVLLALRKHCSASTKTLVSYQHYFCHKSKTQHCTSYYEEINSVQTKIRTSKQASVIPHTFCVALLPCNPLQDIAINYVLKNLFYMDWFLHVVVPCWHFEFSGFFCFVCFFISGFGVVFLCHRSMCPLSPPPVEMIKQTCEHFTRRCCRPSTFPFKQALICLKTNTSA